MNKSSKYASVWNFPIHLFIAKSHMSFKSRLLDQINCLSRWFTTLKHTRKLAWEREEYFNEVVHAGDLFVDPDTGITLRSRGSIQRYIKIKEIHQLFSEELSRVLCIYQHIGHEKTRDRVRKINTALAESNSRSYCCSYETPTVAMFFISKKQRRIKQIKKYFRNYLGGHADRRWKYGEEKVGTTMEIVQDITLSYNWTQWA